jgi:hypothetical protein
MASPTNVDQQFAKSANSFATELYQVNLVFVYFENLIW